MQIEAFKAELAALLNVVSSIRQKTIRDEPLRERFRTLFRSWTSEVRPSIERFLKSKRELLKLDQVLQELAKLAGKIKHVSDYKRRLHDANRLVNDIVIYLPLAPTYGHMPSKDGLFIQGIPDIPLTLVPNSLLGWKSKMETFLAKYPFDKSVFIAIRYRERNQDLVRVIKNKLSGIGLRGIIASEHKLTDDLYNPIACLLCCSKGIVVFDHAERRQEFNPNVAYELGMLHLLGRTCLILKHQSLKALPSDINTKIYKDYSTHQEAAGHVEEWINHELISDSDEA